ncbi:MAG: DUF58 domain-containing protein [Cyanophyceae cyanobacterium]
MANRRQKGLKEHLKKEHPKKGHPNSRRQSASKRLGLWLEHRWVSPSFVGGLLIFFTVFFFAAATNTMAGWLYVISGVLIALLITAAVLSRRSLQGLSVTRQGIVPVSVGDGVLVTATYHNQSDQLLTLSQALDGAPMALVNPALVDPGAQPRRKQRSPASVQLLERLEPGESKTVDFTYGNVQRGVYCWTGLSLRTAAPLGLLWGRRSWSIPAKAVVYPQILPLSRCSLVDHMGQGNTMRMADRDQFSQASYEGLTRSLRPYRSGDSRRLIHWRTSARYGELQVRELETTTSGQTVVISLDTAAQWDLADFEQAASAAASIYSYASRRQLEAHLWTPATGIVRGRRAILETLAAVNPGDRPDLDHLDYGTPPKAPLLWLTANLSSINALPPGSRWLLWGDSPPNQSPHPGYYLKQDVPLTQQLEATHTYAQ